MLVQQSHVACVVVVFGSYRDIGQSNTCHPLYSATKARQWSVVDQRCSGSAPSLKLTQEDHAVSSWEGRYDSSVKESSICSGLAWSTKAFWM